MKSKSRKKRKNHPSFFWWWYITYWQVKVIWLQIKINFFKVPFDSLPKMDRQVLAGLYIMKGL